MEKNIQKTEKLTNAKAVSYVLNTYVDIPADVKEKLERILDSYTKKTSTSKKTTTDTESKKNEAILLKYLENQIDGKRIMHMIKEIPEFNEYSTSKVSAITRKLKEENLIYSKKEKNNVTLFYHINNNKGREKEQKKEGEAE